MVKSIIWSRRAQTDRKEIFRYWNERNNSKNYSTKLNILFLKAIKLISDFPEIGKATDEKNVRVKIVKDYLLFYEIEKERIIVLAIWDSRQDPEKLKSI